MLETAKHPENLVFSIAWQFDINTESEQLDKFKHDPRFKIIPIYYKDSRGACYARNLLQQQYDGEKWTLQLDSHHRFEPNWDQTLIRMWNGLKLRGVQKPLITTYLPAFDPDNDPQGRATTPYRMDNPYFDEKGILIFKSSYVDLYGKLEGPQPTPWYSAHFAFAEGNFAVEVQHDPHLYFHGEEVSIAARAYTWGYDMFYPHILIAYHEYTRKGRQKHWDDHKEWWKTDASSKKRFNYLMGQEKSPKPIDWQGYGFGTVRTLEDYEKFARIDFKSKKILPI
jgi:glycosyltransferase involved in cell wall biosynthesis